MTVTKIVLALFWVCLASPFVIAVGAIAKLIYLTFV